MTERLIDFAKNTRKLVASVFSVGLIFSVASYFLPLSAAIGVGPYFEYSNFQYSLLTMVLLLLFLTTYVPQLIESESYTEDVIVILLVISSSIVHEINSLFPLHVASLAILSVVAGISVYYTTNMNRWEMIGAICTYFPTILLFTLTLKFTSRLSPLPELGLAILGVWYFITGVFEGQISQIRRAVGLKERLFIWNTRLIQTPTGVIVSAIIYTSFYITTSLIVIVIMPILLNSNFLTADISNILVNTGFLFSIFVLLFTIWYWLRFLSRLSYSVDQWTSEKYEIDLEREAPIRPSGTILLPAIGYILAHAIGNQLMTGYLYFFGTASNKIMMGYVVLYLLLFAYTLLSIPVACIKVENYLRRKSRYNLYSYYRKIKSVDPELSRDQWSVFLSGLGGVAMYATASKTGALFVLLLLLLLPLDALRRKWPSESLDQALIAVICFGIFITMFMSSSNLAVIEAWQIMTIFSIIYLLSVVQEKYDVPNRVSTNNI